MKFHRPKLSGRAAAVFHQYLDGRADSLHPEDRLAAERFWETLGDLKAPSVPVGIASARRGRRLAAAAAAALIAILLPLAWLSLAPQGGHAHYATAHGEIRSVELADGSSVRLGAETRIAVRYSDGERRLRLLSGEAIFNVGKDPARPFIVDTGRGEVRALGTSFMVRLTSTEARLVVIEGRVRVTPGLEQSGNDGLSRIADAGDLVLFGADPGAGGGSKQAYVSMEGPADVERSTAWTRGMLYFSGEPLRDVVDVVNRYSDRQVHLSDPGIGDTPVFAAMRVGDTSAVEAIIATPSQRRTQRSRDRAL